MLSRRDLGILTGGAMALAASAKGAAATPDLGNAIRPGSFPGFWDSQGDVRRAGGVLHWRSAGRAEQRPPLVLLHMLGGWSDDWRMVARLLSPDRRVIAFDLPGHGLSAWQGPPPEVQSVEETAALIAGAMTELGLGQVDLAGTSLGGCVAVALAVGMPERVRRLVLPSCALGKGRSWYDIRAKEADQLRGGMFNAAGDPLPGGPEALVKVFGVRDAVRISAEQNASRQQAGRWIRPQERGVALTDFSRLMARITAPTLLLYGDNDTFFPGYRPIAEAALRHSQTVVLPQASGLPVLDDPVATAGAIRQFLDA
ncbi:alpha/beta fold hydrolase [Novosphingobium subterraneum]|uniref:alpha/beta fold hydrolase n=1 Tax=Novosphingobium subterraneum TaxID=48936 RepID=UPI003D01F05C